MFREPLSGSIGSVRTNYIDGSKLFGNSELDDVPIKYGPMILINVYQVQMGYNIIIDKDCQFYLHPVSTDGNIIKCRVIVTVVNPVDCLEKQVFKQKHIYFPMGDPRLVEFKEKRKPANKWICFAGDRIKTYIQLHRFSKKPITFSKDKSKLMHIIKVFKIEVRGVNPFPKRASKGKT